MKIRTSQESWTCDLCKKYQDYTDERYERNEWKACRPCHDGFIAKRPDIEWNVSLYQESKPRCKRSCNSCGRCDCCER